MKHFLLIFVLFFTICLFPQGIDTTIIQDVRGKNIFNFTIHPELPPFTFVLTGDSEYNVITDIAVYKQNVSNPFQEIKIDNDIESPVKDRDYFDTADFNFDGYKDIMLLVSWGVTGNLYYKVWVFNPAKSKFETNEFLQGIRRPEFNYKEKIFTTCERGGYGEYNLTTYKYKNGKWIVIEEINSYRNKKQDKIIEDTYTIKNGKRKLVNRTITDF